MHTSTRTLHSAGTTGDLLRVSDWGMDGCNLRRAAVVKDEGGTD